MDDHSIKSETVCTSETTVEFPSLIKVIVWIEHRCIIIENNKTIINQPSLSTLEKNYANSSNHYCSIEPNHII